MIKLLKMKLEIKILIKKNKKYYSEINEKITQLVERI